MSNNHQRLKSGDPVFEGKSGQENKYVYERIYIIFDDLYLRLQKKVKVKLEYADGTRVSSETNSSGEIEVSRNHGPYVDAEIHSRSFSYKRRVFILLDNYQTDSGAWQRLVNLGYIDEKEPSASPTSFKRLSMAVEEFQAEHGIQLSGELDHLTLAKLRTVHDDETVPWAERAWIKQGVSEQSAKLDNPKAKIT